MSAGSRHFHCPLDILLAFHIIKIDIGLADLVNE